MQIAIERSIGRLNTIKVKLMGVAMRRRRNNSYITKSSKKSNNAKIKSKKNKTKPKKLFKFALAIFVLFLCINLIHSIFREVDSNLIVENNVSNEEFIGRLENISIEEYRRSGILPSITISQAILESNWGRSKLATEGNNLFGIKSNGGWFGRSIKFKTKENYNDVETANFRRYSSWEESVIDHTDFLMKNPRYKKAGIFHKKDYVSQAQALEDAGYATTTDSSGNKIYADKLITLIKKYNLDKYDNKVLYK